MLHSFLTLFAVPDEGPSLVRKFAQYIYINIFAKENWGSNPRPTATPPSTKYQRSNPLSQIAILKKNGSLESGIQT
jgi:hypothetical protein